MDNKKSKKLLLEKNSYAPLDPEKGGGFINRSARKIIDEDGYEDEFLTENGLLRIIQDNIDDDCWVYYSRRHSGSGANAHRDRFAISSNFNIKYKLTSEFYDPPYQ